MGLQEIKDYLGLLLRKDPDIPALKRILAQKRGELVEAMARLQESIDFIDRKQSIYDEVLAGRAEELGIPSPAQILAGLEDNASGSPFPSAGT